LKHSPFVGHYREIPFCQFALHFHFEVQVFSLPKSGTSAHLAFLQLSRFPFLPPPFLFLGALGFPPAGFRWLVFFSISCFLIYKMSVSVGPSPNFFLSFPALPPLFYCFPTFEKTNILIIESINSVCPTFFPSPIFGASSIKQFPYFFLCLFVCPPADSSTCSQHGKNPKPWFAVFSRLNSRSYSWCPFLSRPTF